jgi:hypothetical protein
MAVTGFRIEGLPPQRFAHLFRMGDDELGSIGAVRVTADSDFGFPCRITLEDAAPGETLILTNYEHQEAATPYRSSHAIYVRENAERPAVLKNEVPPMLAARLLSVRAFDASGMMVDADVTEGSALVPLIQRLFANPGAAYLHVHNARRGCFAARIDRA